MPRNTSILTYSKRVEIGRPPGCTYFPGKAKWHLILLVHTWSNPRRGIDRIMTVTGKPSPFRKPAHSSETSTKKLCHYVCNHKRRHGLRFPSPGVIFSFLQLLCQLNGQHGRSVGMWKYLLKRAGFMTHFTQNRRWTRLYVEEWLKSLQIYVLEAEGWNSFRGGSLNCQRMSERNFPTYSLRLLAGIFQEDVLSWRRHRRKYQALHRESEKKHATANCQRRQGPFHNWLNNLWIFRT